MPINYEFTSDKVTGVSWRQSAGPIITLNLSNNSSSEMKIKSVTFYLAKGIGGLYDNEGGFVIGNESDRPEVGVSLSKEGGSVVSSVEVTQNVNVKSTGSKSVSGYFDTMATQSDPERYRITIHFDRGKLSFSPGQHKFYIIKPKGGPVSGIVSSRHHIVGGGGVPGPVSLTYYLKEGSPDLSGVNIIAEPHIMTFGGSSVVTVTGFDPKSYDSYGYQYCLSFDGGNTWSNWTFWGPTEDMSFSIPDSYKDTSSAVKFKVWVNNDDYENSYVEKESNEVYVKLNQPSKSLITPNPISIGEEVSAYSLQTSDTAKDLFFEHQWLNITDRNPISTKSTVIPIEPCYHQYRTSAKGFISSDYSDPSDSLVINYSPRNMIKYGFDCSFSSKSGDVKSLITQDFIFVPTNDIEVSWSSFPLNLHQGQFNRYVVKIVDVENDNAPETVYSTEGANDYSQEKSVTISGILDKIKNNEMTPGHHFEVKLECWYYKQSKGIVNDLQDSEVGTNVITSKRFLLAGFPESPVILYPDSRRDSNLTLNKQPRVIFTCKNPDYLPRSICQIKSATVSYNLGIERKSYNIFVDYDGDGNPAISSGSGSNFLSVKNGEGEELVFVFKMDEISDYSRVVISITCTNTFGLTCQTISVAYISYKNFEEVATGNKINASDASSLGDYCIESVRSYQRLSRELPQKDIDYYLESKVKYSYLDDQGLEQGPFSNQEFLERVTEGQDFKIINTSSEEANVDVALSKVPKVSKADVSLSFEYNYKNKTSQEVTLTKDAVVNVISTESEVEKTRYLKLGYYKSLFPNYPVPINEVGESRFSISEEGLVGDRNGDCLTRNVKTINIDDDTGLTRSENSLPSYVTVDYYPFDSVEQEGWSLYGFKVQIIYLLPPDCTDPDVVDFGDDNGNFTLSGPVFRQELSNGWQRVVYEYSYSSSEGSSLSNSKRISVTQHLNSDMVLLDVRAVSTYTKTNDSGLLTYKDYKVPIYNGETLVDIYNLSEFPVTIKSIVIEDEGSEVVTYNIDLQLGNTMSLLEDVGDKELFDIINSSSGSRTIYVSLVDTDFYEDTLSVTVITNETSESIEVTPGSHSPVSTSGYSLAGIDFITGSLDPNEVVQLFTNWSSGNATFPDVDLNSFIGYVNNGSGQFEAYISPSATYLQKGNNLEIYNNDTSDWKVVCALESLDSTTKVDETTVSLVGDDVVTLPRQNGSFQYEKVTIVNSSSSLSSITVKLNEVDRREIPPGSSLQIDLSSDLNDLEIKLVQDSEDSDVGGLVAVLGTGTIEMTVDEGYIVTDLTVSFPHYNPENLTTRKLFLLSKNKTDSENEDLENALEYYVPGRSYVVKVKDQKGQYQYVSVFKDKLIRPSSVGDEDFDENVENSPRPLQVLLKWLDWFLYEDENYLGLYEIIKSYGSSYSPEIIRSYVLNNSYESSDESDDVVNKINARPGSKKVEVEEVEVLAEGVTDSESEYYKGNIFNIIVDILKYML